jgi:hypothetical protein
MVCPKVEEIERKFLASVGRSTEVKSKVELFYDNIYWAEYFLTVFVFHKHYFFPGVLVRSAPGPPLHGDFTITLRHATFGRTPLDE